MPPGPDAPTEASLPDPETEAALIGAALDLEPAHPLANLGLARALVRLGRAEEALGLLDQAIALQPDLVAALADRAAILAELGRFAAAVAAFDHVLALAPADPVLHRNRGIALCGLGECAAAIDSFRRALALSPEYGEAHYSLGNALRDLGRLDEALAAFDAAVACRPDMADAHHNRAVVLRALGRSGAALAAFDAALALCPDSAGIHLNRGNLLGDLGQPDAALDAYDRALALRPDYVEALNNRGSTLMTQGRHDRALASFDAALRLRPDSSAILLNRGLALRELGRYAEAVASYDRALAGQPGSVAALYNRGNALAGLGRYQEALAGFDAALAVQPDHEAAQINRSLTLKILRRYDEAVAGYEALIARQPDHAEAHTYLGICHLLFGRLRPGWAEYHWRWKSAGFPVVKRDFTPPLWRGDSLGGRTILLHSEQGLGDTFQFCRFVPRVAALGGRVVLEAEESLLGLLGGLGVAQRVAKGAPLPAFDCHCPLLSLPLAFDIDLDRIPAPRRYLSSDGARVARWADRLGPATRPRIGLVWSGNPAHTNDSNRSLGLADFLPLLSERVEIISLQKELRAADRLVLRAHPQIRHYGADLADFSDTAALCDLLDLVISVDTAVAHLAGALGRPVWIVLPYTPDWRWLLDRDDSPWYPSATLYRRGRDEGWDAVIARIGGDLGRISGFAPESAPSASSGLSARTARDGGGGGI